LSSNFSFSGPPYSCSTTAFITYLPTAKLQAWIIPRNRDQLYALGFYN